MSQEFYSGKALEFGETSISGKEAKAMHDINVLLKEGNLILDYGAGKYARNADFLRNKGFRVYAYDPYNGKNVDGWELGNVSNKKPEGQFDVGFSIYVLNVVPKWLEDQIVADIGLLAKKQYHVTRDTDISESVKGALLAKREPVFSFFMKNFATKEISESLLSGTLDNGVIMKFCEFGVQTSKGFQRIPNREGLIKRKKGSWKLYEV